MLFVVALSVWVWLLKAAVIVSRRIKNSLVKLAHMFYVLSISLHCQNEQLLSCKSVFVYVFPLPFHKRCGYVVHAIAMTPCLNSLAGVVRAEIHGVV